MRTPITLWKKNHRREHRRDVKHPFTLSVNVNISIHVKLYHCFYGNMDIDVEYEVNPNLLICGLLTLVPLFSKTQTQTLTLSVNGSLEIQHPSHSSQNFGFANSLPLQYCFNDKQLTDRGMLVFLKFCKILVSARYCIECVQ